MSSQCVFRASGLVMRVALPSSENLTARSKTIFFEISVQKRGKHLFLVSIDVFASVVNEFVDVFDVFFLNVLLNLEVECFNPVFEIV